MKTSQPIFYLCFLLLVSSVRAADDWTDKGSSGPQARYYHAAAYISSGQIMLFGGLRKESPTRLNDTWIYDLSSGWQSQSPSSSPSARFGHAMAYIGEGQVLLFGGNDGSDKNDTWIYDLSDNAWMEQSPVGGVKPSARYWHRVAYIGGNKVLLFGGKSSGQFDDTWVYDLSDNTWTEKSPGSKPSARDRHAMAYIGGDQVLLYGGWDGSSDKNDTWVYDLSSNAWEPKSPKGDPSTRYDHAMAYMGGDQVLLFGGYKEKSTNNESWVYDLSENTWTEDTNTTQPSARSAHTITETSLSGTSFLVLFGGFDATSNPIGDTWSFGGGDYSLSVKMASFTATAGDGQVTLRWVTESEVNNLGFHVHRSQNASGGYAKINGSMIPGAGSSSSRKEYEYCDQNLVNAITYYYKLEQVDLNGHSIFYEPISATPVQKTLPSKFRLLPNYPNPFNRATWIAYDLPEDGYVELSVYNMIGEKISTLVDGLQEAGSYQFPWQGVDSKGKTLPSGIYFIRIQSGLQHEVRKMILVQ